MSVRSDTFFATAILGISSVVTFALAMVQFSVIPRGQDYRVEFLSLMGIMAAYFALALAPGYALAKLLQKTEHNFGAVWVTMATTYIAGLAYFLAGRPAMPLSRVFAEHLSVTALTWLVVVPACWLMYRDRPRRKRTPHG